MNIPHPQAEILRAIADGKTVQMRSIVNLEDNDWWEPIDALGYINSDRHEFRIKPETITINGREVPCPVREPLKYGCGFFAVTFDCGDLVNEYEWYGSKTDMKLLEMGLIHLTEEAAIAHAEALLSFARSDK